MGRTLISTLYEGKVVKIAITKLSPDRLVLIGAKWKDPDRKKILESSLKAIKKTFDFLDIEFIETALYDIPIIVKDIMKVIDDEAKKHNEIIAHISESRKTQALGLLFACYAKKDKVKAVYYVVGEGNKLIPMPMLDFKVSDTKLEILKESLKGKTDIPHLINKTKKSRAMIYAHIQELKKDGYLTENLELTDAGKIVVM